MNHRITLYWTAPLLLLLALPAVLFSQQRGPHSVGGTVFTGAATPAGRGIPVRLSRGLNDLHTMTDQDGKFLFTGVANGTYSIDVDAGGDFEQASQRLEIALPKSAPAQMFLVDFQLRLKASARAKPGVIDAGMASVPKTAVENYRKGLAAAASGDDRLAVELMLQAVAEHPEFVNAHSELGILYLKLNDLNKADEHLRTALKLKPASYDALANQGVVLVRLKRFAEAESVLREAIMIRDGSAAVHLYLGRSLAAQKKFPEAEASLRTALKMGGKDMIEAHRALANIYLQQEQNDKALVELESYLAANPTPADEKQLRAMVQQIKQMLADKPKQ